MPASTTARGKKGEKEERGKGEEGRVEDRHSGERGEPYCRGSAEAQNGWRVPYAPVPSRGRTRGRCQDL
eukprot:895929-Rhodomonas_salina.1